ncbi:hypothetical protein PpBr36_03888 [Pyricularia pennisetigena]|uniref:hypothetical protein n=1 Tax=Pyricularia pennisetigena TaxID=1578925 RepID=UPI001152BF40|nr:hypothetical protein PpBr36_03888 [Pyricularia pennisetigena]TLS29981.1 hypothetical protein PpBr36_03888 [Pyricularia pennisetigena]
MFSCVSNSFGLLVSRGVRETLAETIKVLKCGDLSGSTSWAGILWWGILAVAAVHKFVPDAPETPNIKKIFPEDDWCSTASANARPESPEFVAVVPRKVHLSSQNSWG